MDFPFSYFEDEVRDGFLIPSIMKKNWAANYNAYETLSELCDKLGLKVFANWGSLLGAVRHGGMIPWDDDIDVEMTRKEYLALADLQNMGEFPGEYWLVSYSANKIFNSIIKFADYKNLIVHPDDWENHCGFPFAAVIDIFMLDYVPRNQEEQKKYETLIENAMALEQDEEREKYFGKMAEWLGVAFDSKEPREIQLAKAMDRYLSSRTETKCDQQTYLWHYLMYSKSRIFPNLFHEDTVEVPFELGTMKIPIGYDGILRLSYGNYMETMRAFDNHDYPNYQVMEEKLEREYQSSLLRYKYDSDIVQENKMEKKPKLSLREELLPSLELLAEAHRFITNSLGTSGEWQKNLSDILDILGQCQTLAISIGNQIEERAVQGKNAVKHLEYYCDVIFRLYGKLGEEAEYNDEMRALMECESAIREDINNLRGKKEIVFLPYKAEHWRSLHTLWEDYTRRGDTVVTVIPVPYYYRDFQCEPTGELLVEMEGYPEEVELTSYKDYNFEVHHPDVVIYQFPYDEYSYALTLHPFFYASNLVQYAEKMVFIPPFKLHEIEPGDNRSRYTLGCFIKNPGLIYADEIMVQSEQMRNVFIDILEEFTGVEEKQRIDWNKKIVSDKFPLSEWERRQRVLIKNQDTGEFFERNGAVAEKTLYDEILEIPSEWLNEIRREEGTHKKVIVYYVSGSMMLEYRDQAVRKIEQVLDIAEKNKSDLLFLWHTDSHAREILRKRVPKVWSAYRELMERFVNNNIGILDDSGNYRRACMLADAYYGDGGVAMNECRMLGKPIMWENPEVVIDS